MGALLPGVQVLVVLSARQQLIGPQAPEVDVCVDPPDMTTEATPAVAPATLPILAHGIDGRPVQVQPEVTARRRADRNGEVGSLDEDSCG